MSLVRSVILLVDIIAYHPFLHLAYCLILCVMRNVWDTVEQIVNAMTSISSHHTAPVRTGDWFTEKAVSVR